LIAPFLSAAMMLICTTAVHGQSDRSAASRPEQTVIVESRFAVTNASAQAELVQLVVDFAPGAWTSFHTHGGQAINLVLEGEITLRQAGVDRVHKAGQAWTDSTGILHAAGNTGTGQASLLTNFLLPEGAPQTTAQHPSQLEPTVLHEARFPLPPLPAETEIVQQVVDLPSGWRLERKHDGFAANLVIDGEVTDKTGPEQKTYRAGESWSTRGEAVAVEENSSIDTARVFTTYLLWRMSR